jgi:hypothetical protein
LVVGVTSVRNGFPTFVDLDRDGDEDLVIGGSSGQVLFYRNVGTPSSPAWNRDDAVLSGVRVRQNASLSFADMDGDGKADVIAGEYNGNFSYYKNQLPSAVVSLNEVPARFALMQNYPNPFNPTTEIGFRLPENSAVTLSVYDVLGRDVATLVNERLQAGNYARTFDATTLASGVYVYRLQAGKLSSTRKLIVTK